MSEHAVAQPQRANTPQEASQDKSLWQRRYMNQPELATLQELLLDTASSTFAEPRFGYDFSHVPVLTGMKRQNQPLLRTQPGIQRFRKDEASVYSSCPECTETESPRLSEAAEPTVEGTEPAPEIAPTSTEAEPTAEETAPEETAAQGLIVEDSAETVGRGQMKKSEFLSQLRVEVCRTVEEALAGTGRTTEECPYLDHWFDFYSRKDSAHIERTIHRYAPDASNATTASGYIFVIAQRARQAAETWARTGEITGVPEGIARGLPGTGLLGGLVSGIGSIFLKARKSGVREADDPQAIQSELGEGQPVNSGVRLRMESVFGIDFSHVRAHTDTTAAGLSARLNARAFTVGEHVAFGSGEYQPGTLKGDALIAHEMAHVVQQSSGTASVAQKQGGDTTYKNLEDDADKSAVFAVASLWRDTNAVLADIAQNAMPRLRSGLRLQRCGKTPAAVTTPEATPARSGMEPQERQQKKQQKPEPGRPTLRLGPDKKLTRGQTLNATVNFTPDADETLNVRGWQYTTTESDVVTRPAGDADFQTQWKGKMVLSGTLTMNYQTTSPGGTPIAEDKVEEKITVKDRTGTPWQSKVAEEAEDRFSGQPSPPKRFRELGRHDANAHPFPNPTSETIKGGPNETFSYVSALTAGKFISRPLIHPDLTNKGSRFFLFHKDPSRLYLIVGKKKILIPLKEYSNFRSTDGGIKFDVPDWEAFYKKHNFYTVTAAAGGKKVALKESMWKLESNTEDALVVEKDSKAKAKIQSDLGIPSTQTPTITATPRGEWEGYSLLQSNAILAGTRRHEYKHQRHSHRANLLAIMRALDPQRMIERTVATPGNPVDFSKRIPDLWKDEIRPANESHDLVDEKASRENESFVASDKEMAEVNVDPSTGKTLGSIWNITDDKEMDVN